MIPEEDLEKLVHAARRAREQAYAPYSHYRVGAAVLTSTGAIYTGCNIESASYGLTVCAERVAVWKAVSAGEREIVAVAVATSNAATPCGACRQVLAEFRPPADKGDMTIVLADARTSRLLHLADLLPYAFLAADLDRE